MPENEAYWALASAAQLKAARYRRRSSRSQQVAQDHSLLVYSPSQREGRRAEDQARRYLEAQGLVVLQHNLRCKAGEIDLVCKEGDTLVFVEVRQRSSHHFGGAAASVNRQKQQRIALAASFFLPRLQKLYFNGRLPLCRFDVIALEEASLQWIKAAFAVPPMR